MTPERLGRELGRVKLLLAVVLGALTIVSSLLVADIKVRSRRELTVERINVVEPDGTLRVVLASSTKFPLPKVGGKEYPREVSPAGLVFYDTKGSEVGGIALTDNVKTGRLSALAFDYPNYDAIGFLTHISPDGKSGAAGIQINSRPPANVDLPQAAKVVERRIAVMNRDENAEILLADAQGRDRIRLRVDPQGEASIEILDPQGAVVFRAPAVKN